jgi:hypothetical protein
LALGHASRQRGMRAGCTRSCLDVRRVLREKSGAPVGQLRPSGVRRSERWRKA